ncbi:DNA-binding protein [Klebsiella pneumoniae subsp. ozaenae]|uniref:DNA-binding protein n=5 Tax=Klebsiella pneumoniae TaxID=573 RepID=A0A378BVX4_KLEPO|nr:DNA-binding protein [Klebsiella pneumoniae subsp. ozaenae]
MFRLVVHVDVKKELQALPPIVQAKMIRQLDKLRQNPTALREPDSKPLGQGLFEIRALGSVQGRGIYVFQQGKTLFLLRVFVKKTQKTVIGNSPGAEAIRGDAQWSKKIIDWDTLKTELLGQPEVQAAFDAQERQQRLRTMLAQWREQAGLTRAQVAQRMGVSAPTVSRMEANITRASLDTLTRYALACGIKHPASFTLLTRSVAIHLPAQINDRSHGP